MVGTPENKLKLSSVMATCNRAETIRETLYHLGGAGTRSASYEVIVCDYGWTDHTRALAGGWVPRPPYRLSYLHTPTGSRLYGRPRAKSRSGADRDADGAAREDLDWVVASAHETCPRGRRPSA